MAKISNMKEGQVLYTVTTEKAGNTNMSRTAVHPVKVTEIDPDKQWVKASWNGNGARKYIQRQCNSWRVKKPSK